LHEITRLRNEERLAPNVLRLLVTISPHRFACDFLVCRLLEKIRKLIFKNSIE
jgi:hypothetical protein